MCNASEPTPQLVREYVQMFNTTPKFINGQKALRLLYNDFPRNTNIKHIFIKAAAVNSIESTRILDVYGMAQHIHKCRIDMVFPVAEPMGKTRLD
jgi:hypothetical protein